MMHRNTFLTLSAAALFAFGVSAGEDKKHEHEHKHGPNGGDIAEIGDKEDHHAEIKHDEKKGTLTVWILNKDMKAALGVVKEAPKLNLKAKSGNKQIEMTSAEPNGTKWEATDDVLKEEPDGRIQIVLDGKKYNVKLEHHH